MLSIDDWTVALEKDPAARVLTTNTPQLVLVS
jgi:hypothetical protein